MNKWIIMILVIVLGASHLGAYKFGESNQTLVSVADAATQAKENAEATAVAVVTERKVEQAAQAAVNEVASYAVVDQAELASALAIANGTVDRLQSELKATRDNLSGAGSYSSLAERSASATRAAMVLSDLYGSCQRRVVEVTGLYQDARSRGLNCSTSYDKVSKVFADDG